MPDSVEDIHSRALREVESASSEDSLLGIKAKYLGRSDGELTLLIKRIGVLPPEERPSFGKRLNDAKRVLEDSIDKKLALLKREKRDALLERQGVDITLPGRRFPRGTLHPVTRILNKIVNIFVEMGFEIAEGPEVELDYYNFEALNFLKDHPARDMQDTFYFSDTLLLRTHTSPVQIRVMEKRKPPLRVIVPGKVFRRDSDVSHTPMFHQVEGLMVGSGISMAHLKGVVSLFFQQIFGKETTLRFRPSFFPFTEPSAEVDLQCRLCGGDGCRVCGNSGWVEVMGCGMVHPNVFKNVGYPANKVTGFAFGLGVERITLLIYEVDDIRLFFENDLRFLKQS